MSQPIRIAVLSLSGLVMAGLVGLGIVQYRADQKAAQVAAISRPEPVKAAAPTTSPAAVTPAPKKEIWVHVSGAVQNSGVYQLPEGARVADALKAAGGPTPEGRPDALNLAEVLPDGAKIYIPSEAELKAAAESVSPSPVGSAATVQPVQATVGTAASGTAKAGGKVNVNTASAQELDSLDGIGPALAARIIEYRQAHGPFKSVQDLTKVKGIGTSTLAKFQDRVTV